MNSQNDMEEYKDYHELKAHEGNEKYEIKEIRGEEFDLDEFLYDIKSNLIVTTVIKTALLDKDVLYNRLKISRLGNIEGEGLIYETLKDGTMWTSYSYNNWIINGDSTKHTFLDPLEQKDIRNADTWLAKFKELYDKATYVHVDLSKYYFKIDGKWYFVNAYKRGKELGFFKDKIDKNGISRAGNIRDYFPAKEDQDVRMVELEDLCPRFSRAPEKRDTSLIKEVLYRSEYFEKTNNPVSTGFSAGWWYLNIYLPGDTIRIKRFAPYTRPEIKIFRVPEEYGGRNDVLFIIQKPEQLFQQQVGGMYVIRPRGDGWNDARME